MTKFFRTSMFLLIALSFVLAACGTASPSTPAEPVTVIQTQVVEITSTPGPAAPAAGSITINGAGATFPFPLYSKWFYDYAFVDTSAKFNYQSIGSGGGIKQITEKTVDFGASDRSEERRVGKECRSRW